MSSFQLQTSVFFGYVSSETFVLYYNISSFPIPDFRPATDMSKPPWWERNVRPDYLTLVLCNASFRTILQTDQCHNEYNVECKLLDIFYYENDHTDGMHIARCGLEEGPLVSMQHDSTFLTK